jgi:hypothetical protein
MPKCALLTLPNVAEPPGRPPTRPAAMAYSQRAAAARLLLSSLACRGSTCIAAAAPSSLLLSTVRKVGPGAAQHPSAHPGTAPHCTLVAMVHTAAAALGSSHGLAMRHLKVLAATCNTTCCRIACAASPCHLLSCAAARSHVQPVAATTASCLLLLLPLPATPSTAAGNWIATVCHAQLHRPLLHTLSTIQEAMDLPPTAPALRIHITIAAIGQWCTSRAAQ